MLYRIVLFFLFTALAAPLEYHVGWFMALTKKHAPFWQAIHEPLVSGALFFYSVIVVLEAFITLEMYPEQADRVEVKILKILSFLLVIPFAAYLTNIGSTLDGAWITAQWALALASFLISVVAHAYITRVETLLKGV